MPCPENNTPIKKLRSRRPYDTVTRMITISVKLTPNAAKNAITGWANDAGGAPILRASVTAIAEKGKANKALIALLSKEWKIPKSAITIVRGETDRLKTITIDAEIAPEHLGP